MPRGYVQVGTCTVRRPGAKGNGDRDGDGDGVRTNAKK